MAKKTAITPTREEDFSAWFLEVVKCAELAEHSPVRGCMVIKPWGYAIWEKIQFFLNEQFKRKGVQNAYFPLFIPLSYFEKEAKHVEGFATECAVVTHHRLEKKSDGSLVPASPLEEPLIVRPTSELLFGEMFAKWIQSYRDLPMKINQWANVVRWEMRPRIFLRTAEFLWQEGHTAHASSEEADNQALEMLNLYAAFAREYMAMPSIKGEKSENERFPGAARTYTFEMMMQDCKALQAGTSHYLGQNFAKASGIKYLSKEGDERYCHTTSWGCTTRLIGSMVMMHSDDDGLIMPPRIASSHVVLIPIIHKEETRELIEGFTTSLKEDLCSKDYYRRPIDVVLDNRDLRGGEKNWQWIKKGVPLRIEIGMREMEEGKLALSLRTRDHKDKLFVSREELLSNIVSYLDEVHAALLERAENFLDSHVKNILDKKTFYDFFGDKEERVAGFAKVFFSGSVEDETEIKKDLNVTVRCIPFDQSGEEGICFYTGKKTRTQVIFAKSY